MKTARYVLVINCGSSSIKLTLFKALPKKQFEEIEHDYIERVKDHGASLKKFFKKFKKEKPEIFKNIVKVGHRVVHGGEKYVKPTRINKTVIKGLKKLIPLAPLHNPANVAGIRGAMKLFPKATHYAVFDTGFHATLPEKAYLYSIPYELYKEDKIRRYGFHGISHEYVTGEAISYLKNKKGLKIISCHLGNGASLAASVDGKSIDTSMGFTPLEGIAMGTRSGDIDPAIIFYLANKKKKSLKKIENILQRESGIKGMSGLTNDLRDTRDAFFKRKNKRAERTMQIYCYKVAKYIGAYTAALNGVDAIIFTATIGEKADYMRKWTCEYLSHLGVKLDNRKNRSCTDPKALKEISDKKSKVKVFVIPTNEALQIARQG